MKKDSKKYELVDEIVKKESPGSMLYFDIQDLYVPEEQRTEENLGWEIKMNALNDIIKAKFN